MVTDVGDNMCWMLMKLQIFVASSLCLLTHQVTSNTVAKYQCTVYGVPLPNIDPPGIFPVF